MCLTVRRVRERCHNQRSDAQYSSASTGTCLVVVIATLIGPADSYGFTSNLLFVCGGVRGVIINNSIKSVNIDFAICMYSYTVMMFELHIYINDAFCK